MLRHCASRRVAIGCGPCEPAVSDRCDRTPLRPLRSRRPGSTGRLRARDPSRQGGADGVADVFGDYTSPMRRSGGALSELDHASENVGGLIDLGRLADRDRREAQRAAAMSVVPLLVGARPRGRRRISRARRILPSQRHRSRRRRCLSAGDGDRRDARHDARLSSRGASRRSRAARSASTSRSRRCWTSTTIRRIPSSARARSAKIPRSSRGSARRFIRGVQENGMIATGKHFPGHGDTGRTRISRCLSSRESKPAR